MGEQAERLEGEKDEGIAGEHGQRFAERLVHRGHAATRGGIVETRQVVVDERGAVHELDRAGRGIGRGGIVLAAGGGDGERQARTHPGAGGENGMMHRRQQARRARRHRDGRERRLQRLFDTVRHEVFLRSTCPVPVVRLRCHVLVSRQMDIRLSTGLS